MADSPGNTGRKLNMTMRDVALVVFRHKKAALVFFLAVVCLASIYTFTRPPVYRSDAKLLIRLGRESVSVDPTATTDRSVNIVPTPEFRESEINSEVEILDSRALADAVVKAVGPKRILSHESEKQLMERFAAPARGPMPEPSDQQSREMLAHMESTAKAAKREAAIRHFMGSFKVSFSKRSHIITLSYEAPSAFQASYILKRTIDVYLQKHLEVHRVRGSYGFFQNQSQLLRKRLNQIEDELRRRKNLSHLASADEQKKSLMNRIGFIQRRIEETEAALAADRAGVADIKRKLKVLPSRVVSQRTSGFANQPADRLREQIYLLKLKEQDLLTKFQPKNRLVRDVRAQIAEAERMLSRDKDSRTQVTESLNLTRRELLARMLAKETAAQSHEATLGTLRMQLGRAQRDLTELNNNEMIIGRLERERRIQESNFLRYVDKLEQARIAEAVNNQRISNVSVVQDPTYSRKPVKPNKRFNLGMAFIFAFWGALGLIFVLEQADRRFKTPEELERKAGLRVLAFLPHNPGDHHAAQSWRKRTRVLKAGLRPGKQGALAGVLLVVVFVALGALLAGVQWKISPPAKEPPAASSYGPPAVEATTASLSTGPAQKPSAPPLPLAAWLGLAMLTAGLSGGASLAWRKKRRRPAAMARALGLPLLAQVPRVKGKGRRG